MISCDQCLTWIENEPELNDSQREAMLAHLTTCESCKAVYESFLNIEQWFHTSEDLPEHFSDTVMDAIHRENREKSPLYLLKRFRFTAVAAVAAVLVLAISAYFPNQNPGESVSRSAAQVQDVTAAGGTITAYDGGGTVEDVYVILSELGCSGQLVVVDEALADMHKLFPKAKELVLENGEILLKLDYDEFDQNKVTISQIQVLPDGAEKMIYLYSE